MSDWSLAYKQAVHEVNAIEREILGDQALDIPSHPNPSVVSQHLFDLYFQRRPVAYYFRGESEGLPRE